MPKSDVKTSGEDEIGLLPIFTLVLWLTCLFVAIVGFAQDDRPSQPTTQPTEARPVELLSVDLTTDFQSPESGPPEKTATPIAFERSIPPVDVPAVAPPAAIFEFQPLAGLRTETVAPVRLTFGQGEGRQPSPDYPREAVLAGEEGTVVARFDVGDDGRVENAKAIIPCPWPVLNQSVLRTIRHDWRFSPGPPRTYEISIEFQINRR